MDIAIVSMVGYSKAQKNGSTSNILCPNETLFFLSRTHYEGARSQEKNLLVRNFSKNLLIRNFSTNLLVRNFSKNLFVRNVTDGMPCRDAIGYLGQDSCSAR